MIRHLVIFAVTFAVGALIAVILRTGSHKPYEGHTGHPAPGAASAAPATAYDAADPHAGHSAGAMTPAADAHQGHDAAMPMDMEMGKPADAASPGEHAGHAGMAMPPPAADATPAPGDAHAGHQQDQAAASTAPAATAAVNTICAVCGMPVDPTLGTIAYKGKLIGFGCKTCPAKFRADPAKYGEAALKNQVVE